MQLNNDRSESGKDNSVDAQNHEATESEMRNQTENVPDNETSYEAVPQDGKPQKKKRKIKLISVIEDERSIVKRTEFRATDEELLVYNSRLQLPIRLFVEAEAVVQIMNFVHWDVQTPENRIEQAALMYGRLCEYEDRRWGEVCGIIPANTPNASPVSVVISANEWTRLYASLDKINDKRKQEGEQQSWVVLGWLHTHPNTLDVFFSSDDRTLQHEIMNNNNLFGLVINPHRRMFACFADADSNECVAAFVMNKDIRDRWNFAPKEYAGNNKISTEIESNAGMKIKTTSRDIIRGQRFDCKFEKFLEPMTALYNIDIQSNIRSRAFSFIDTYKRNNKMLSQRFNLTFQGELMFEAKECNEIAGIIRKTSASISTIAFVQLLKGKHKETVYIPKLVTLMPIDSIWTVQRRWLKDYYIFLTDDRLPDPAKQSKSMNNVHGFVDSLYKYGNDPSRFNIIYYNNTAESPKVILIWANKNCR